MRAAYKSFVNHLERCWSNGDEGNGNVNWGYPGNCGRHGDCIIGRSQGSRRGGESARAQLSPVFSRKKRQCFLFMPYHCVFLIGNSTGK
ncbi:uncharacterized [Tachysurus ichikawai]